MALIHQKLGAIIGAAAVVATLAGCGGSADSPNPATTVAPVTIDDLKPTVDHFSRQIIKPSKLGVPKKYDDIATGLAVDLTQILKISFLEPSTWKLTSDTDVVGAVAAGFGSIGDANSAALGKALQASSKKDAVDGERIVTRYGSTFAAAAKPSAPYVYEVTWDASVDEKSKTVAVTAVLWAGYEVDGGVVVTARQFTLNGIDQGASIGYSMKTPISGGFYDLCSSVVDGVLTPGKISEAEAAALRKEFADTTFRPLSESIAAVDQADGSDPAPDRAGRVEACLAKA